MINTESLERVYIRIVQIIKNRNINLDIFTSKN